MLIALPLAALAVVRCASKAPPSYVDLVRADHPVSYWRFDERDPSPSAHDGVGQVDASLRGGVTLGAAGALAGDSNRAFAFDGSTGLVVGPDVYAFDGTHPFTVEVWIAPDAGGLPVQRICNHRFGLPHTGWRMILDETKHVVFDRWSGDVQLGAVLAAIPVGVYSHVVGRYDGAALTLYVDGDLRQSAPDAHPIAPFSAPLVWAAASTGVIDFFSGKLDEAAIYDFALAPDHIAQHYAAGVGK